MIIHQNIVFQGIRLDNGKNIRGDLIRDKDGRYFISPIMKRMIYASTVVDGNIVKLTAREVDPESVKLVEKIYCNS